MRKSLTALAFALIATGAWAQTPTPAPKLEPPKTTLAATPAPPVPNTGGAKASPTPDPKASPAATPDPKASPTAAATPAPPPATPAPLVVVVQQQKEPESNNSSSLIAGWLGLAVLGVGGFFGWRALKSKGMTVTGAFKQLGVELPQEAPPAAAPVGKPAVAPLPPLPSLSDLPSAGAAPAGVAVASGAAAPSAPPLPAPTGQPKLVGYQGPAAGKVIPLLDALTVGREPDNTLSLPTDSTVSRKHAVFLPTGTGWELSDSGSANGTFVNGQRLTNPQVLSHGDEIKIGSSRLRYEA
ncbi:FHA domain-containing protein [Armatimonas sp.]|uniref:FHA domain-containing protein n=1 Tax=Armatimonas sp. TaxID=1872638 RepID=UPI00286A328D|nr:FHA domain-containing protein [Armatimonas sp.]